MKKKCFIIAALAVFIVVSSITLYVYKKKATSIDLYLHSYGIESFDESKIIKITEKEEIEKIKKIMKLNFPKIGFYGPHSFMYDSPGFVEIHYKNGKSLRYFYFENKTGFYCRLNKFICLRWYNNSFDELFQMQTHGDGLR